jgi:single-strand DNA-binding protein
MLNQIVLVGNIGNDPDSFFTPEGTQIASFSLAFTCSKKATGWVKCSCFGRTAEIAVKFLHKGARIGVQGTLDQHHWTGDDGSPRSSFQINCNQLEFIKTDGRGFEAQKEGEPEAEVIPF